MFLRRVFMIELDTCDKCNRTGRAKNLKHKYGQKLCPDCDYRRYFIMLYFFEGVTKILQVMDTKEGQIIKVLDEDYINGNMDAEMKRDLEEDYESKVLNKKPYY